MTENTENTPVENTDPAEEKRTVVEGNGVSIDKDETPSAPVGSTVTEETETRETTTVEPQEPQQQ